MILSKRYPSQNYFEKLVSSDVENLISLFYDNRLFTYDVDELMKILEKVEKFTTLVEILDKPKVPKRKTESLYILALFDKLLNSGFKKKVLNQRRLDILMSFNPLYQRVNLNDKEFLTPHFRFIEEFYKPDTKDDLQDHFLGNIALRNLYKNN